jgi:tetratricopeptide (TPR) repeat protein
VAEEDDLQTDDIAAPQRDRFTNIALVATAVIAVVGFGAMFSRWWQSSIADPQEILRIASQEFINGNPIVAGDLAKTVTFDLDSEMDSDLVPDNPDDPVTPAETADEAVASDTSTDPGSEPIDPESEVAKEIAKQAEKRVWVGLRDFLVGAGIFAQANNEKEPRARRSLFLDAADALQKSAIGGFRDGQVTHGHQMLGDALYELGRHDDAIEPLTEATRRDPRLQRQLLPKIADSQLRLLSPMAGESLKTIDRYLDIPGLQETDRWLGELIRIRALTELQRYQDVDRFVDRIRSRPRSANALLEGAEIGFRNQVNLLAAIRIVKQAIARQPRSGRSGYDRVSSGFQRDDSEDPSKLQVDPELQRAINILGELGREASPRISSRARLWQARALQVAGQDDEALIQLTAVRQQRPFSAEAIVSGLEEIEWLAKRGRGQEVLQTVRYIIRELGDPSGFDAELVGFEEFQRRVLEAIAGLRRAGEYENAIDTARSLPPVFDLSDSFTQEGISYQEWAESTMNDGTDINGEVTRGASELARSRFRASGDAFAAAAKARFNTEEFLPAQWAAIEAYQKGRHFRRSIGLLKEYLRYERRSRLPRGLVAYGRALLAEGKENEAMKALTTCIVEYPRDPLRYDARLMVAMAKIEDNKPEEAIGYLMENLQDGELTPDSPAWKNSLFTIGELHYELALQKQLEAKELPAKARSKLFLENQDVLEQAIRFLDEAVARYWPESRAESAAYLSARCHVLAAQLPEAESQSPGILEAARRSLRTQVDQELQIAMDGFLNLKRHLLAREDEAKLSPKENAMLRNCFMCEAEMLREMDRLEEAAQSYRTVELRYMNQPLALEAILHRANCVRRLGRSDEADLLIRQASVVLGRIPKRWDNSFQEITRFDRNGWQQYLSWMNGRIAARGA